MLSPAAKQAVQGILILMYKLRYSQYKLHWKFCKGQQLKC